MGYSLYVTKGGLTCRIVIDIEVLLVVAGGDIEAISLTWVDIGAIEKSLLRRYMRVCVHHIDLQTEPRPRKNPLKKRIAVADLVHSLLDRRGKGTPEKINRDGETNKTIPQESQMRNA